MKEYLLMHKDTIVGGIVFNSRWQICDFKPSMKSLLPIGIEENKKVNIEKLNRWFLARNISPDRRNFDKLQENTGIKYMEELIVKNGAFSLFDCYWIKESGSILNWKGNNFYTNDYDNSVTAAFAKDSFEKELLKGNTPSLTIPGTENYVWQKNKDAGNMLFCFEKKEYVLTEYFLTQEAAPIFGLPKTVLALSKNDAQFCAMPIFTSENTEYVPAVHILNSGQRDKEHSQYHHFLKRCRELNIPKYKQFMECLLCFDYVFHITGRNYNDFGFLRNTDTNTFIGPAPVFRNGYGLFHAGELSKNKEMVDIICFDNIAKTIMQIDDPTYLPIDFEKIEELPERIYQLFSYNEEIATFKREMIEKRIKNLPLQFTFLIEKKAGRYKEISKQLEKTKTT